MERNSSLYILGFLLLFFVSTNLKAQLSAPGSAGSVETNYSVFQETDSIYAFCVDDETIEVGELRVTTQLQGTKTFSWEIYNNQTASFEDYFSEGSENQSSTISGLATGCYRATVTLGANTEIYRAWIINSWINSEVSITDSNCESFKLNGSFTSSEHTYYDLANNTELILSRNLQVQWKEGESIIAIVLNPQIYSPPTEDTDYTFRVYDRFGCELNVDVIYESIVTKASFDADPIEGEAPLEVVFSNTSENGDLNGYEWYFYRDLDEIKEEAENSQGEIDSIMLVAYDESPIYTYENTGVYMVKLISQHYVNDSLTCRDTFQMEDYITVDSSFIKVPNVFTPNGDGTNDEFVVKFWSMKSIKITVFNRWGKKIHYWDKSDIRGFEETYVESVWDGKIGGRYASPGVYYYVVEGNGRDGEKRRAHGFVHLFRGKN